MKFEQLPHPESVQRARELIDKYGWNTTCCQILNVGIERDFGAEPEALIGYVRRGRCRVAAGAPVCRKDDTAAVIAGWEAAAKRAGDTVCWFGAERRAILASREMPPHSEVILGSQPVWDLRTWDQNVCSHASFRAQLNRARNKGVEVVEWPSEKAENNAELKRVLAEWLSTRGLPPMHFLVEPWTLPDLKGRRMFVAERNGVPIAFLTLSPIPQRNGCLTEQFPRGKAAVNGTVELLMDTGARAVLASGVTYLTMGIVPLSNRHHELGGPGHRLTPELMSKFEVPALDEHPNPVWLNWMLHWVKAHGRRFYNFDGLDAFKSKFHPDAWEPIYAISNEAKFSVKSLIAIAAAFSDGPLASTMVRALGKAARQEAVWLVHHDQRPVRSSGKKESDQSGKRKPKTGAAETADSAV